MPVAAVASKNLRSDQTFSKHADGTKPRVLYAEDSTASRIVTTAMLKRMGLEVDAVEDGELALRHAEKSSYDIILLDISGRSFICWAISSLATTFAALSSKRLCK